MANLDEGSPDATGLRIEVGSSGTSPASGGAAPFVRGTQASVVADWCPGSAEGEEDDRDVAAVRHLAAGRGPTRASVPTGILVLDFLDDQGQGAGRTR